MATTVAPANDRRMGNTRRSTITDVAERAGVSIKTVSRVVRKEPNVSEDTRKLVEAAVAELHYRPTISARSTVSARSFLLGLVFDNPNLSYSFQLLLGAQQATKENGYHLIFEPLGDGGQSAGEAINQLVIQSNLDGIIVPPPLCDDPSVLASLSKLNRAFVRISPSVETTLGFNVTMDDWGAAKAMTDHLIGLGHKRIGFVLGREGTATTRRRMEGYKAALEAAGMAFDEGLTCQGDFLLRTGLSCGESLLSLEDRPTAIFASNDDMASGILIAAHRRGLRVPEDLSVCGFDDAEVAAVTWPPLTTIRQPIRQMAAAAAEMIIGHRRSSEESDPQTIELPFELIVRESTGPAPLN